MRLDGARVVDGVDDLRRFLPLRMPSRAASVLFFQQTFEVGPIEGWLLQANEGRSQPYRLFHLVLAAMVRTLAERPGLNRYVCGGKLLQRPYLSLTFSVKQGKRDDAKLSSIKVIFEPTDGLEEVRAKVDAAIAAARDPERATPGERELAALLRLPRPLARGVLAGLDGLQRLGLAPRRLLDGDPMHTSAFVANLGSIGLDASFHHLSDAGSASLHATLGRIKPVVLAGTDGLARVARGFELKLAVDDRICDGLYCAGSLLRLEHWLSHPAALAAPAPRRPDLIPGRLWARADAQPEACAYRVRSQADGRWYGTTWQSYRQDVRAAGSALLGCGVGPGDRVAIQGANRPEWAVFYLAALAIGAVPCGLHEDLSPAELDALLQLAQPRVVLLDAPGPASQIRASLPGVQIVLVSRRGEAPRTDLPGVCWDDWLADGAARDDGGVERRMAQLRPSDPAVLVFTSGTTGKPRAAVLTHDNLAWTAETAARALGVGPQDTTISYLPLSHVAEQSFTVTVAVTVGGTVAYAPSRAQILETLREVRPTVFFGVPQIWARLRRDMTDGLRSVGLDRVRLAISGAARLEPELWQSFADQGLELLETYGQSEGSGPTTLTLPGRARSGAVGAPLPGVQVRLAEDGEVLVRGRNVFAGYYADAAGSAAALADGWLHSGDLGRWDGDQLRIVGRKKELCVTSGGEKIAPAPLESALASLPLVAQAVVVGTGRPHLGALLTLDADEAVRWLSARGEAPCARLDEHPEMLAEVERSVAAFNASRSKTERVLAFRVLPRALSVEDGELTPTLKVRREVVLERWKEAVEGLYGKQRQGQRQRLRLPGAVCSGFVARPAEAAAQDPLFALRYRVFLESGLIEPERWPGERMVDRFDPGAVQFGLWDTDGELAGTARLVPHGGQGLPVFDLFDFERLDLPPERTAEVGRLAIAPQWRGRRAPLVSLVRATLDHARSLGYTHVYAFVPARAIRGYAALGLPVWERPMLPPRPETLARRAAMSGYFATQDPRVVLFTEPAA
jgi:long-chain acyl-CoA synthetase